MVFPDKAMQRLPLSMNTPQTLQRDIGSVLASGFSRTPLYYTTGHGELDPQQTGDDGLNTLLATSQLSGFDPIRLTPAKIAELGRIPDDGVLCIPGPQDQWDPIIDQSVRAYVRDGGPLFAAIDHRTPAALGNLLRQRGVLVASDFPATVYQRPQLLLEDSISAQPQLLQSVTHARTDARGQGRERLLLEHSHFIEHAITQRTQASNRYISSPVTTPLLVAHPLAVPPAFQEPLIQRYGEWGTPRFQAQPLLAMSAQDAWARPLNQLQVLPDGQQAHQHLLAVLLTYDLDNDALERSEGRSVIWGSRQALSDTVLSSGVYANELFIIDTLNWLADREPIRDIPPAELRAYQVTADDSTWNLIQLSLLAILPGILIAAAMLTWWDNR